MTLRFRPLSLIAAGVCFALAFAWLFAPQFMLTLWGVDGYTEAAGLVARRGGALFLGIGVMFMMARRAPALPGSTVMSAGFAVACLSLAVLGLVEFAGGHAGVGILSAVAVELAFALGFVAAAGSDA